MLSITSLTTLYIYFFTVVDTISTSRPPPDELISRLPPFTSKSHPASRHLHLPHALDQHHEQHDITEPCYVHELCVDGALPLTVAMPPYTRRPKPTQPTFPPSNVITAPMSKQRHRVPYVVSPWCLLPFTSSVLSWQ